MKTFTLNKKSWHFWLAKQTSGFREYNSETDICRYIRAVLHGALSLLFLIVFFSLLTCCALFALYATGCGVWWLLQGVPGSPDETVQVGLAVLTVLALLTLIALIEVFKFRRTLRNAKNPEPGFLELAYASFKGKLCVKIKLED